MPCNAYRKGFPDWLVGRARRQSARTIAPVSRVSGCGLVLGSSSILSGFFLSTAVYRRALLMSLDCAQKTYVLVMGLYWSDHLDHGVAFIDLGP